MGSSKTPEMAKMFCGCCPHILKTFCVFLIAAGNLTSIKKHKWFSGLYSRIGGTPE
jgi:hypothetical protein